MRKITLLLVLLGLFSWSFGQVTRMAFDAPVKGTDLTPDSKAISQKGGGDVIWTNTFDWADAAEPRGWKLPDGWAIGEDADNGFVWVWRNDTIRGNFTTVGPPSFFDTPKDGFIVVPIDEYNAKDGVTTSTPSGTWIQTPKIDCSGVGSVVVNFKHYFRLCCSNYNLQMLVTNDDGVHWATYDVRFDVAGNTFTPVRFRDVEINISDVAAGSNNVQIRFYMFGPSHYFWMIDDLALTEAYTYDLVLEDFWANFNGGWVDPVGHINYWPMSQMGMDGDQFGKVGEYTFRGAMLNLGVNDAEYAALEVEILKNGTEVVTKKSAEKDIWSLDRDSSQIDDAFLADDYGDYQFNFSAVMTHEDQIPGNNHVSLRFTVTDTLAHRADLSAESSANTGGWVGGNNAGDMVGVSYDLYADTEIDAITAYLTGFSAAANAQFQYVLMKDIEGTYEEWIASEVTDMTQEISGTWVTLEVQKDGETEFLTPGNYAACVRMWGEAAGDADGVNGMSVGWDMDTKPARTLMYQAVGGNWYSTGKLNMIGMVFNQTGGPTQAPVTFNVDMTKHIANGEFLVGSDFLDVSGSFNGWTGSAHFTDADADGIYTLTLDGMPVGQRIEYKYRINGNWDTSEFPMGGPNRTYVVRYWNVLNHVYNNGATTSIIADNMVENLIVYPNPTSGKFTVDISTAVTTNLSIVLMDIQGQVVYQNMVSNVTSHQETIDTSLAKGLYFLTVRSGKDVQVRKVVVQ